MFESYLKVEFYDILNEYEVFLIEIFMVKN